MFSLAAYADTHRHEEPSLSHELAEARPLSDDHDLAADIAISILLLDAARRGRMTERVAIDAAIERLGGEALLDELHAIGASR